MALSYYQYISNGANAVFPTPEHLEDTHIKVYLDGVLQSTSTYIHNGISIIFTSAPANGTVIRIARETNHNGRLTDYNNTAALTAEALDYDATQTFYMAQEAIDISRDGMSEYNALAQDARDIVDDAEAFQTQTEASINALQTNLINTVTTSNAAAVAAANAATAEAQRLINISEENYILSTDFYHAGGSAPLSPDLGDFWYDTTRKELNVYDGSSWGTSAPENQTLTFDDTDFDASETGYNFVNVPDVNEHIFVFLNGVKQVKASTKDNLLAATGAKDYFVDVSNNRVYFKPLNSGDSIEVILSTNEVGTRNKTKIDNYTATQGQTVFNTTQDYIPDSNSMHVFVNGIRQTAFTETDENTVTLTNGLNAGDEVTLIVNGYEPVQGTTPATRITYVPTGETTSTLTAQKMFDSISQPNLLINGDFGIWQRGTSFTDTNVYQVGGQLYDADRWESRVVPGLAGTLTNSSITVTREEFILGQTTVPNNPAYYHRFKVDSLGTLGTDNIGAITTSQPIEDVRTCAGKEVTISFYAKCDTARDVRVVLAQGFDTNLSGSGWPSVYADVSLTTNWEKHTVTLTLPSLAGKTISNPDDALWLSFVYYSGSDNNGTGYLKNQNYGGSFGSWTVGTFDLAQVKVEEGSNFTGWPRVDPATELVKCQKYYVPPTPSPGDGALVYKTVNQTVASETPNVVLGTQWLEFGAEEYDTHSIADLATDNQKLVVPSGVSKVRLTAQVAWKDIPNTPPYTGLAGYHKASIEKGPHPFNKGQDYGGRGYSIDYSDGTSLRVSHVQTGVVSVNPGDYFRVAVSQDTGQDLDVRFYGPDVSTGFDRKATWFNMEIIA